VKITVVILWLPFCGQDQLNNRFTI